MPDIREVLASLDTDDKARFLEARNVMRRAFMAAHAAALRLDDWTQEEDAFLDLIDIKLALLFDRSGRMVSTKTIVDKEDSKSIEDNINQQVLKINMPKDYVNNDADREDVAILTNTASDATKLMQNGWTTQPK